MSSSGIPSHSKVAVFHSFGNAEDVVVIEEVQLPETLEKHQALVKTLAANINPSDLASIRGVYGRNPTIPGYPGFEGVFEVIQIGDEVKEVAVGDWVISGVPSAWREYAVAEASKLIPVKKAAGIEFAAGVVVNPCSAYRMIKDFLPEGKKVIIQNGANSSVGVYVIQMAREWGLKTINVIRKRDDEVEHAELVEYLKSLGADLVVTEEDAEDAPKLKKLIEEAGLDLPAVAFDCISGSSSRILSKALDSNGVLVNYGIMSGKDVFIDFRSLLVTDIVVKGFWLGRYMQEADVKDKVAMINAVVDLAAAGKLQNQYEKFSFHKDLQAALKRAQAPKRSAKVLLTFDEPRGTL